MNVMDNHYLSVLAQYGAIIKPQGIAVYGVLLAKTASDGYCYVTVAELAASIGCSENTVRKALQALGKIGLVTVERRRDGTRQIANAYRLVRYPASVPPAVTTGNAPRQYPKPQIQLVAPKKTLADVDEVWRDKFSTPIPAERRDQLLNAAGGDIQRLYDAVLSVAFYWQIERRERVKYPVKAVLNFLTRGRARQAAKEPPTQPAPTADRPFAAWDTDALYAELSQYDYEMVDVRTAQMWEELQLRREEELAFWEQVGTELIQEAQSPASESDDSVLF